MLSAVITSIGLGYVLTFIAFFILVIKIGYPYHRSIALGIWLISLIPFVLSLIKRLAWIENQTKVSLTFLGAYWPHIILLFFLLGIMYLVRIFIPFKPTELKRASEEERKQYIAQDTEAFLYLTEQMTQSVQHIQHLTTHSAPETPFRSEERIQLQESWKLFVNTTFELDLLKHRYKSYIQLDHIKQREDHQASFILAYSAFTLQYTSVLKLVDYIEKQPETKKMFNEARDEDGIAANTWDSLQEQLTSPETLIKLTAGRKYLYRIAIPKKQQDIATLTKQTLLQAEGSLPNYPRLFAKNPLNVLERKLFSLWFPVQKNITRQISYIRRTDREYYITPKQLAQYREHFQPGTILLERRNWHITNVGIPGFWTHAALYVGTEQEMDRYFTDTQELEGTSMSAFLRKTYPETMKQFTQQDEAGFFPAVIEVNRPGVIMNSLETSANADALAVLKPKVSKQANFDAVVYAFSQVGKPYDFNFDFATDNSLVCSELVYKSYGKVANIFPDQKIINGRQIVSPNDIAEKFSKEYNTTAQSFELTLFLDSDETQQCAVKKDVKKFLLTWKRPKWYLLTQ